MKTKRMFLLLLALLMTASACGTTTSSGSENTGDPSNSDAPEVQETVTETELKDAVPEDLKFNGEDFKFFGMDQYGGPSLVEGETGDVYNDAIYRTELYTEDRLGVNISEELYPTWEMQGQVRALAAAGDTTYDAYTMTDRWLVEHAQEGIVFPVADIPYVDLSQIYWGGEGFTEDMKIGGRAWFAVSSFNMYSIERAAFVMFNNTVAERHNVKIPYDEVFAGKWTLDMLKSYGNIATIDVDGNGVMDSNDSYTYDSVDVRDTHIKLLFGAGGNLADIDENGMLYPTAYGNEKAINLMELTYELFFAGSNTFDRNLDATGWKTPFQEDRVLIQIAEFRNMPQYREMESDFSILPMPKYDENQSRYCTYTGNSVLSMVPVTCTNIEKAGAVLEVMSCEGYKSILPAYIESYMANKMARNQESADAIKLIYDTRVYDLGKMYLEATLSGEPLHNKVKEGNSIVSYLESVRSKVDERVKTLNENFAKTVKELGDE